MVIKGYKAGDKVLAMYTDLKYFPAIVLSLRGLMPGDIGYITLQWCDPNKGCAIGGYFSAAEIDEMTRKGLNKHDTAWNIHTKFVKPIVNDLHEAISYIKQGGELDNFKDIVDEYCRKI